LFHVEPHGVVCRLRLRGDARCIFEREIRTDIEADVR
jgi:hypothetical protein